MNKKIIAIIVGVIIVGGGGVAYFAVNGGSSTNTRNNQQVTQARSNQAGIGRFLASTTPATIDDLKIGDEITVVGSSNTDGSMSAQTILIGSIEFEPGQFNGGIDTDGQLPEDFANRQPPERFNPEELQNLTPEERQARFAELQESGGAFVRGGFAGGGQGGRPSGDGFRGGNMVRGEILDIDDIAITIALPDGGSRLVLYSSQTTILRISKSE